MSTRELQAAIETAEWDGYLEKPRPRKPNAVLIAWGRGWAAMNFDLWEGDVKKVLRAHRKNPTEPMSKLRNRVLNMRT